jgi:hypothetical protein
MVLVAVRAVDRPVAAGLERHLSFFAAARARRAEHLARPAATRRTVLSATLSLARRAAVRAAPGWIVEAATGVVLLLADGEDEWLAAITAGQRRISVHAAVPQVNGPPLARRSSGSGSVAISGTGSSVGQVNALCHTPSRRGRRWPGPELASAARCQLTTLALSSWPIAPRGGAPRGAVETALLNSR